MKIDTEAWEKLGKRIRDNNLIHRLSRVQLIKVIRQTTGCSLGEAHNIMTMLQNI